MGYWVSIAEPVNRQWRAMDKISKMVDPGILETSQNHLPTWVNWTFPEGKSNNIEVLQLSDLDRLDTQSVDDIISHLKELPHLKELYLYFGPIQDRHVDEIATLRSLQTVEFFPNQITDVGAAKLLALPNIETLNLEKHL